MGVMRQVGMRYGLAAVLLVMVAGGCGGPDKQPPDKVIEKAVPAIKAATTFHFSLETAKLAKPPSGLFITKAEGDVAKPDKLSGDLSALYSGLPINVKVVVDGKSQYMTDPASGKWGAMPPAFNVAQFFDPSKGVSDILANIKGLSDDGTEAVGGADSYRLKGMVPASALKSLSSEVTAQGDLATTVWIGAGDFLLRRVQLQGPIINGEPADIVRTITLSDYNKAIKIETPAVK
ncbi:MAG TPA: LppX_LprAFG lipoprotein [Chloroflexia bacterium]|nr:LppX_LprAFG lipoprotein [Chloroflexia bacterium]